MATVATAYFPYRVRCFQYFRVSIFFLRKTGVATVATVDRIEIIRFFVVARAICESCHGCHFWGLGRLFHRHCTCALLFFSNHSSEKHQTFLNFFRPDPSVAGSLGNLYVNPFRMYAGCRCRARFKGSLA